MKIDLGPPRRSVSISLASTFPFHHSSLLFYRRLSNIANFSNSNSWKKQLAEEERTIAGYIDVLYPDRPDEPVPSTHELAAIAGKYYHPGYGAVHFEIQTNPRNVSENVLIADRSELAFPAQWQLEHVSGDDWLIWRLIYNGTRSTGAYAARIETSVSGNVESINLKTEEAGGKPPTWIVFSRQGYQ